MHDGINDNSIDQLGQLSGYRANRPAHAVRTGINTPISFHSSIPTRFRPCNITDVTGVEILAFKIRSSLETTMAWPGRTDLLKTALLSVTHFGLSNAELKRFVNWFPESATIFADVSAQTCNHTLKAFERAYNAEPSTAWIDLGIWPNRPIYQLCRDQMSCILTNVSEADKASMATTGVILGILPTLLAVLSPSISELALLSVQRPLLAAFTSLGAPGVLQTRVFEYEDPSELVDATAGARVRSRLSIGPWSDSWSWLIGVAQLLLAVACAVNTLWLAVDINRKSIVSWGCTRTWFVLTGTRVQH
jgi:hypothetical protein